MNNDTNSIHGIKEKLGESSTLIDYFKVMWGANKKNKNYKAAQMNFARSLAGYSLVCYILQIKDRHNGNILMDKDGHIMHIDFGFLLSSAPGKGIKFEQAPFKMTEEYVDCLGGINSDAFKEFRHGMARGFRALQTSAEKIIIIVEMMFMGQNDLGCFKGGQPLIGELKDRLFPGGKRKLGQEDAQRYTDGLLDQSMDNWRTNCYDCFQNCAQGIL